MILIDTVGFISNLPNTLIDGFKTTLESALEADLLIIVADISDPNFEKQLEVTQEVLNELGVKDKEQIIVFNKRDLLNDPIKEKIIKRSHSNSFVVSSFNPDDVRGLRDHVINWFLEKQNKYDLFVPYENGEAHSIVAGKTNIMTTHNHETGIFYRVRVPAFIFDALRLNDYILAPDSHIYDQMDLNSDNSI